MRRPVLTLACLVAAASLFAPPVTRGAEPMVLQTTPLEIDGFGGSPARRAIRVGVLIGACTTRVDLVRLRQRGSAVAVELSQTTEFPARPDVGCVNIGLNVCITIVLARPLGKRTLVDLASGTTLRAGSGSGAWPRGVAPNAVCRHPGRMPAWQPPRDVVPTL